MTVQVCLKTIFQYIVPFVIASAKGHGFWYVIQGDIIRLRGTDWQTLLAKNGLWGLYLEGSISLWDRTNKCCQLMRLYKLYHIYIMYCECHTIYRQELTRSLSLQLVYICVASTWLLPALH